MESQDRAAQPQPNAPAKKTFPGSQHTRQEVEDEHTEEQAGVQNIPPEPAAPAGAMTGGTAGA